MTTDEIATVIATRLEALAGEIDQLTAARDALLQNATRERLPAPEAPRRNTRRRRSRRHRALSAENLEQLLSDNGGTTTATLAREAETTPQRVLAALRELEQAGTVRRTGQRRGTRWHLVTDEDRIEARAKELAARSPSEP